MEPRRLVELDAVARRLVVDPGVAPAAAVAFAVRGAGGWFLGSGAAGCRSVCDQTPIAPESPFDLASVTKPFVAASVARLWQLGALDRGASLGALLPALGGTASAGLSIELLLAHRAGLDAHRTLYAPLLARRPVERRSMLLEAACARRAGCPGDAPGQGFPPLYSDLGYLLVGAALEQALGSPLDAVVEAEVLSPLGLDVGPARKWLRGACAFGSRVVPTEHVAWRGGALSGVVHDENAWALAGHGLAGQAGLFGTAASVARFGAALLDASAGIDASWLSREATAPLLCERAGGSLRAGFDGKSPAGSSAGSRAGPRTFGHLGFTGTSLWCDPDAAAVVVLLTNRVNPTRDHVAIRSARPRVHDALFEAAERHRPSGQ